MRRRRLSSAGVALLVAAIALAGAESAIAAIPAWPTYHRDALRSGVDPDSTSAVTPTQAWQSPVLDEHVYAEPLLYGALVYVATENDTVYALDAATGAVVWQKSAGTAVPAGELPCGDISPNVGITSTPVIDPTTNRIYVVAESWDGTDPSTIKHQLVSFDLNNGAASSPVTVDPQGSDPRAQLQRPGLALDGHEIVIGYGGNSGDCGSYHGWLVGAPEAGSGPQSAFEATSLHSGDLGGAIWGSGNAPAVDARGNIYVATGNGWNGPQDNPPPQFDYSDALLKLSPSLGTPLDYWAPSDWQTLDATDADLGSSEPLPLPGGFLFQAGKDQNAYLVRQSSLGGVAAPAAHVDNVCSGATFGGGVYYAGTVYVACLAGLLALSADTSSSSPSLSVKSGWHGADSGAIGPPIIAGGRVWSTDWNNGELYALDPQTGAVAFHEHLGTFMHFSTPSAGGGRLFVAADDPNGDPRVTALTIARYPAPASPSLSLTHVRLTRHRFRGKRGTTLRLTVSDSATVSVAIKRRAHGRKVHGHCRRGAKHGKRCSLLVVVKRLRFSAHAGANSFKLRLKGLRPGDYFAGVTASAATGTASHQLQFTIKP